MQIELSVSRRTNFDNSYSTRRTCVLQLRTTYNQINFASFAHFNCHKDFFFNRVRILNHGHIHIFVGTRSKYSTVNTFYLTIQTKSFSGSILIFIYFSFAISITSGIVLRIRIWADTYFLVPLGSGPTGTQTPLKRYLRPVLICQTWCLLYYSIHYLFSPSVS